MSFAFSLTSFQLSSPRQILFERQNLTCHSIFIKQLYTHYFSYPHTPLSFRSHPSLILCSPLSSLLHLSLVSDICPSRISPTDTSGIFPATPLVILSCITHPTSHSHTPSLHSKVPYLLAIHHAFSSRSYVQRT